MSTLSNDSTVRKAANLATVLFVLMVILQLMLAAGILPVTMAWGGREPVLTNCRNGFFCLRHTASSGAGWRRANH